MPIIYRDVIQGTSEWAELRCGIPTASQFHRIITPNGEPSKQSEVYLYELIAERILREPTVGYTSHWMDRGSDLELEAVNYYEFLNDCSTEKVGFILNDAKTAGASPDRLVGDPGLLEIKVGKPSTHIGLLLKSGKAYEEHRIQTQGQLLISERDWNDLLAYNPGLPPALYRATREEPFLKMMNTALQTFCEVLEAQYQSIIQRGIDKPRRGTVPTIMDLIRKSLIDLNKTN